MSEKIIAIDGDWVMLDYNASFKKSYEKEFGVQLTSVIPNAFHAIKEFGLKDINTAEKDRIFVKHNMWREMSALGNAVEMVNAISDMGYKVVCLTTMPEKHEADRLYNLQNLGFKVTQVIAAERKLEGPANPKKHYIENYKPVAFIDDLLKNFQGCENLGTELVWLDRQHPIESNLNTKEDSSIANTIITDLSDYVEILKQRNNKVNKLPKRKF